MFTSQSPAVRNIRVNPAEYPRVGTKHYAGTLPLEQREVVLTFDDGPSPPCTDAILETFCEESVTATFFVVGYRARRLPELVKRTAAQGHTIATHTEIHRGISDLSEKEQRLEIQAGICSTAAALGRAPAPFFRFPYFDRTPEMEKFLAEQGIMVWATDIEVPDWKGISVEELVSQAIVALTRKGRGILTLHDTQPVTAAALPMLLRELKRLNFRIAHAIPA